MRVIQFFLGLAITVCLFSTISTSATISGAVWYPKIACDEVETIERIANLFVESEDFSDYIAERNALIDGGSCQRIRMYHKESPPSPRRVFHSGEYQLFLAVIKVREDSGEIRLQHTFYVRNRFLLRFMRDERLDGEMYTPHSVRRSGQPPLRGRRL